MIANTFDFLSTRGKHPNIFLAVILLKKSVNVLHYYANGLIQLVK